MSIYHKHHIIPRHMGGTDDPSNLINLLVEDHAEAHRMLWEEHGHIEDYIAWKGLAGIIGKEEIIRTLMSHTHKGKTLSKEHIQSIIEYNNKKLEDGSHPFLSIEIRDNTSKRERSLVEAGEHRFQDPEFIQYRIESQKNKGPEKFRFIDPAFQKEMAERAVESPNAWWKQKKIVTCPHCGKEGHHNAMQRWHFDNCKFSPSRSEW